MLADVNVKQIVITTVIVVLTVAGMYAVWIVAWSYVNAQYLRKNMIEGDMVGAEVLRAKDPPAPRVRRPTEPVIATSPDGEIESNTPSEPLNEVAPEMETQQDNRAN